MNKVFKYEIALRQFTEVSMPQGATILSAGLQFDNPRIWCSVDPSKPLETRRFLLIGTGDSIPDGFDLNFISTMVVNSGHYVFHLFEVRA